MSVSWGLGVVVSRSLLGGVGVWRVVCRERVEGEGAGMELENVWRRTLTHWMAVGKGTGREGRSARYSNPEKDVVCRVGGGGIRARSVWVRGIAGFGRRACERSGGRGVGSAPVCSAVCLAEDWVPGAVRPRI